MDFAAMQQVAAMSNGNDPRPKPVVTLASEIATLHDRLLAKDADYKALVALQDEHTENVLSRLSASQQTHEQYLSLAGELRGLRAARGATTKRGRA